MKHILIVDDHADLRRLVRWSLEDMGHKVAWHEATSGVAGLRIAADVLPELTLLDVMMPGELDGLEVCRRIRATPALAKTCIVLLSACGQASDVAAGMAAGANAYLVKPFSPQRLRETVQELLAA